MKLNCAYTQGATAVLIAVLASAFPEATPLARFIVVYVGCLLLGLMGYCEGMDEGVAIVRRVWRLGE